MKKMLILTNLITLLLLIYCCFMRRHCDDISPKAETNCLQTSFTFNENTPLIGLVNLDIAERMSKAYAADDGKRFIYRDNLRTNIQDSRNIWFDLKKLKNFIAYIEYNTCKKGCTNLSDKLGVRFYYGKYPDESQCINMGVKKEFANHHTLFLVPTYFDENSKTNIDFDPKFIGEGCKPNPLTNKGTFSKGNVYLLMPSGDAQNHGNLQPPPDETGSFSATN